ncbi:MAG: peroxiredoxin Q/BCP [Bradymonadia bacterium]|jgi:peroxiredoxin Q/BCP
MPILSVGDKAPAFTLATDSDGDVSLSDYAGKNVVLYFYPKDDTPGCTNEACDFRDRLEQLEGLGAVVLGVSADSVKRHANFRAKYELNFPLLSDPEKAMLEEYGAWQLKKNYGREYMGISRTTYLIDGEGVVRNVWEKVRVWKKNKAKEVVHRHVDDVREALEALK